MVVFVLVLMEGLVVQMESAFVMWDWMDQLAKHVTFDLNRNKFIN